MVNRLVITCNKAWGTSVEVPIEDLRYHDELNTDDELGRLPETRSKRLRDKSEDSEDEGDDDWDPNASVDMVEKGQKPRKRRRKDECPTKQPYHGESLRCKPPLLKSRPCTSLVDLQ